MPEGKKILNGKKCLKQHVGAITMMVSYLRFMTNKVVINVCELCCGWKGNDIYLQSPTHL